MLLAASTGSDAGFGEPFALSSRGVMSTTHAVPSFPATIVVSVDKAKYLLEWRDSTIMTMGAALVLSLQPSLSTAQVQMQDPDRVQSKPKPQAQPKKAARKQTPTDNVSELTARTNDEGRPGSPKRPPGKSKFRLRCRRPARP